MQLWCAEEEVPTAAKENLYRGRRSHVGWHSDNEPLFGERREAKLVVSVSFGTQALFRWKGKSCPNSDANSCCLGHRDILVMDGQCQDEFLHGSEQERINVTFRWIRQHVVFCPLLRTGVACCVPTCAQGSPATVMRVGGNGVFLGEGRGFWVHLGPRSFVYVGGTCFVVCIGIGLRRCACRWGIICVACCEFSGWHKNTPLSILGDFVMSMV